VAWHQDELIGGNWRWLLLFVSYARAIWFSACSVKCPVHTIHNKSRVIRHVSEVGFMLASCWCASHLKMLATCSSELSIEFQRTT
jgi:hypothetical protein